ncbi:SUN domain-containing protein 2-like [Chanos chanos]|uniref:SUN domain-containing protein 2-like n=1 Tax=Chanos chanos TaxID=29144 RepID=A0A6J2WHF4_CHACN|nr:SUN domain-containing protein 2-like [Chanos chanos]
MPRRSERLVSSGYYSNASSETSTSSTGSTGLTSYRKSPLRRTVTKKTTLLFLLISLVIFGIWFWSPSVSTPLTQTKASIRPDQHTSHRLETDIASLRVNTKKQREQEMAEMQGLIGGLKEHVSSLQSTSDLIEQRMDTLEKQHAENTSRLKLELCDRLFKFLSSSVSHLNVVLRSDLQEELENLEKRILERLGRDRGEQRTDVWRTVGESLGQEGAGAVTIQDMEKIVQRALSLYRGDGIGMADYALESAGASVINTRCSEPYQTRAAYLSLFGFPVFYWSESPRVVIQPEVSPGKYWAFRGSEGFVGISLSYPIHITHVTLDHLPRVLSPTGQIDNAPQDFAVYGMSSVNEAGNLLGKFSYDQEGESVQTFKLPKSPEQRIYRMVELRILNNWGHPEYTCVYCFRVHGEPLSV